MVRSGLSFGLGLVHRLFREDGVAAVPEELVLRLPRPAWVPALTTIDDAVGPTLALAGDTLRLALDEVLKRSSRIAHQRNIGYRAFCPCSRKSRKSAQMTSSLNPLREPRNRPAGLPELARRSAARTKVPDRSRNRSGLAI